ncbi:MAG: hypothetical protein D8M59_04620 [Planctomycetes bacterium]|nr:hypothetical protein [Planctomycetota bacterium]NOG55793.1 hypothetical protein [Planctomycetota bacterium]
MLERLSTLAFVLVAAVVIWMYAEGEILGEPFETELTVTVKVPPDSPVIIRSVQPRKIRIKVEGPQARIDDLRRLLAQGTLELDVGMNGVPAAVGTHELLLTDILMQHRAFYQRGISMRAVDPPVMQLSIDRWSDAESIAVRAGNLHGIEIVGAVTLEPADVDVRFASSLLQDLPPERRRVVAEPDPMDLQGLSDGQQHTITAKLTCPDIADPTLARFSQPTVRMTLSIKSKREQITRNNVPVKLALLVDDTDDYAVELVDKFIPELQLMGPSDVIARIRDGSLKVFGYVDLSTADLATGITQAPVTFPFLPASVSIVSGPYTVQLTVSNRSSQPIDPDQN